MNEVHWAHGTEFHRDPETEDVAKRFTLREHDRERHCCSRQGRSMANKMFARSERSSLPSAVRIKLFLYADQLTNAKNNQQNQQVHN